MPDVMTAGRRAVLATLLATTLAATACSGSSSGPSSPTYTPSTPTIETFSGTVAVGGTDFHSFTVKYSGGELDATLTAAGPPDGIVMGFGLGVWADPTCTPINGALTATAAGTVAQLGGTSNAGSYCVAVFDAGNQTSDVTYSVTVSHY